MNKIITTFVDNGIEWLRQKDLLMSPDPDMHTEMVDSSRGNLNDWRYWKSIKSTVTDSDILKLEERLGYNLPSSYKAFLKYKHFYNLKTIDEYEPFKHLPDKWYDELIAVNYQDDIKEYLTDRGFFCFGDYSDSGYLCFDSNSKRPDNEFPIILIDHEEMDQHQVIYVNFLDCLLKNTVSI